MSREVIVTGAFIWLCVCLYVLALCKAAGRADRASEQHAYEQAFLDGDLDRVLEPYTKDVA